MKVILLENLRRIGSIGEIIDVKRGFARNFLISNKKALYASKENIAEVEKIKTELGKKDAEKKKEAQKISEQINGNLNHIRIDLTYFKSIWLIIYTLLFASILSFVNIKRIKNSMLGNLNLGLNALILFIFLTQGLYDISELRESYLSGNSYYQGSLLMMIILLFISRNMKRKKTK